MDNSRSTDTQLILDACGGHGIVVGYEKDQIIRHVRSNYRACLDHFRFIENPAFAETNNIYSLWLAREWLKASSFICLNADVAFDSRILLPALSSEAPITMIVDPVWRDEAMKVTIAGEALQSLKRASKNACLPESEISSVVERSIY
jgi:choline kinase